MTEALREDAQDLLLWLNAHSVSIADGIPVSLLQQKWQQSGRTQAQLKDSLELLFSHTLVAATPGVEPAHVRLSPQGFQRLLTEVDRSRIPIVAPIAPTAPANEAATFRPTTLIAKPSPASEPETTQERSHPRRFLQPGKSPTEIALRNQVLHVFRDLKLQAGQQLIAITLSRYWQEMGLRTGDLRLGIDVLLRDRYLQAATKRYESFWQLTDAGYAYLRGPITPATLLAQGRPMSRVTDSYSDTDLVKQAWQLFLSGKSRTFGELQGAWKYGHESLLHALDLLHKSNGLHIDDDEAMTCTPNMHVQPRR